MTLQNSGLPLTVVHRLFILVPCCPDTVHVPQNQMLVTTNTTYVSSCKHCCYGSPLMAETNFLPNSQTVHMTPLVLCDSNLVQSYVSKEMELCG